MKALATVVAVGAVTPVGLRAVETGFSHRAASAAMREAPLVDAEGEPITMCFLPTLDPWMTGAARLQALAGRALAEALEALGPASRGLRVRVGVSVGEAFAGRAPGGVSAAEWFARDLASGAARLVPGITVEATARGPAGPGYLLPGLCDALASGAIEAAVVGGAHTDYDPRAIAALCAADRLFGSDNLDALIPGEAAAFAVLMRPDVARRLRLRAWADLHAVATAFEKARPDNDEPAFRAAGLTAALRAALGPLADEGMRAGWVLTDLTFETFRHFEMQAAVTRTQRHFCEPQQVDSPAQRMGNLGAAAMPLHVALAVEGWRRGWAPHPFAVSIAGSDGGERAALLMSAAR